MPILESLGREALQELALKATIALVENRLIPKEKRLTFLRDFVTNLEQMGTRRPISELLYEAAETSGIVQALLSAVHESKLDSLIDALGMRPALLEGRIRCAICSIPLNIKTIEGIYPDNGDIKAFCSSIVCVLAVLAKIRGEEY